jgi:hypothetical protein
LIIKRPPRGPSCNTLIPRDPTAKLMSEEDEELEDDDDEDEDSDDEEPEE